MQICVSNVTHTRLGTAYFTFQTSARPIVPPVKLLQSYSTLNLASSPASPSASLRLQHSNNASPSSSGGASGVSVFTRSRSSATSSTLTAGSDRKLGVSFVFVLIEHSLIMISVSNSFRFVLKILPYPVQFLFMISFGMLRMSN